VVLYSLNIKKYEISKIFTMLLLLFLADSVFSGEKINVLKPAHDVMWSVKKIAVLKFENNDYLTNLFIVRLNQYKFFEILPPEGIETKLQNRSITQKDLENADVIKQICAALQVDGIFSGTIIQHEVSPDEHGSRQIKKNIWTGNYERDADGKIIEELVEGEVVKKKLFEERTINQKYIIRKGSVSIAFSLLDGKTGFQSISTTLTKVYDSGIVPEEKINSLPAEEKILRDLSNEILFDFAEYIRPKSVTIKRDIEDGEGLIDEGKVYATSNLWKEAIETWQKAERISPNNSAVYYNLGLAYEAKCEYEEAEVYYKKALLLKDKNLYKDAIKDLRKGWELKEKKLKEENR